jgi:hypothetical protein
LKVLERRIPCGVDIAHHEHVRQIRTATLLRQPSDPLPQPLALHLKGFMSSSSRTKHCGVPRPWHVKNT